ncbi:microcompartments protein [Desulforamulus reducens MI-1]|uniref:Microcompartments protein n=1 Tax=Desulforamulus reducens (strain ATCC BAA-1160 / DSM 100696 / MI-1) TaxID=349161 RepID=A4J421_DESRM|nr:BMC domain-containing protein [Desulforamulus reducens]ABO49824.1 microcompartments protein [Desulforamulus reducens MI-1]
MEVDKKARIIQEYVPGKQVTLSHIIAHPIQDLYRKLGVEPAGAIGILTLTPGETAIIAADIATKAADVAIGFLDRFTGSVVVTGDVAAVDSALKEVNDVLNRNLGYTAAMITRS